GAIQSVCTENTEIQKKSTKCRQPETECVQPWKRHIPRADHQRDQVIRKSQQDGNCHEENHGCPVHGEHAVEDLRRNKIVVWIHQLDADDDGFDSSHDKKKQGVQDIEKANSL